MTASLPISCFGKLPFHREYIRVGLEGEVGRWLLHWTEEFHAAVGRGVEVPRGARLRLIGAAPSGNGLVIGVLVDSTDGMRRHPIGLAVETTAAVSPRAHLAIAAPIWEALEAFVAAPHTTLEAFLTAVRSGCAGPDTTDAEDRVRRHLAEQATGDPWTRLTGLIAPDVLHVALNLRSVGKAQREARSVDEGVAAIAPLAEGATVLDASAWLAIFVAASGVDARLVLLADDPSRVLVACRPIDGAEGAQFLARAESSVDVLADAWQTLPVSSPDLARRLASVGTAAGGTLDDVVDWVRSAVAT